MRTAQLFFEYVKTAIGHRMRSPIVLSCTIAAAASEKGGMLTFKNRDEAGMFGSTQAFAVHRAQADESFSYAGLVSQEKAEGPYVLRAGTNERGLTVVNAWAGTAKEWPGFVKLYDDGRVFMEAVLKEHASVESVRAALPELMRRYPEPEHYLLTDSTQILLLEVAPDGQYKFLISNGEPVTHTNAYELLDDKYNTWKPDSPFMRAKAIKAAFKRISKASYTLEDFIAISHLEEAGPYNSIFRMGDHLESNRTLATIIMESSPEGVTEFYLQCYATRSLKDKVFKLKLDGEFWERVAQSFSPGWTPVYKESKSNDLIESASPYTRP